MNDMRIAAMVTLMALGTMATRFLPFVLFPEGKQMPRFIEYLGKILPFSMVGLLVVYSLRSITWTAAPFGIPEVLAGLLVAGLHVWKRNSLFSIGAGTVFYMFLVQVVFV